MIVCNIQKVKTVIMKYESRLKDPNRKKTAILYYRFSPQKCLKNSPRNTNY